MSHRPFRIAMHDKRRAFAEKKRLGVGVAGFESLLGDILASSLVCKHAHDSSAQAKTFPRCNDKP